MMKTAFLTAFSILSLALAAATLSGSTTQAQTQAQNQNQSQSEPAGPPPDRAAFHAALEACATQNNIAAPTRGARPSESDRRIIEACLQANGFSPPPGGHHHHHEVPPTADPEASSANQ